MMTLRPATTHRQESVGQAGAPTAAPLTLGQRAVVTVVAVALILASTVLPLWEATLIAPQYPGGLHVAASGSGITGDIAEIDSLNHYIGMRAFDSDDVPELALWPLAVGAAVVAAAAGALARRRWIRRAGIAIVWLTPVGVLADIQVRLYQYGHGLDPLAALRIDEFTPWVIGPTKVWNFTTWARPGIGLLLIAFAALILTTAPWLARWLHGRRPGRATVATVLLLALLIPATAVAEEGHHHGHGDAPRGDVPEVPGSARPDVGDAGLAVPEVASDAGAAGAALAERLAHAREGETIVLEPRTYRGNFVIDVPVTLEGGGATLVTTGAGSTLTIEAPGTVIRGLHVHGSGPGPTDTPCGIRIEADDVTVESTIVHDAYIGIGVKEANGVRLAANHITGREDAALSSDAHAVAHDPARHGEHAPDSARGGRGDAISLWDANGILIRDNILESARDGILVSFGSDVFIDRNMIHDSRYAIHSMYAEHLTVVENTVHDNLSGLVIMYGGPVLALRNLVTDNLSPSTGFGVLLKDVVDARIRENTFLGNSTGIHVDGPTAATGPSTHFELNTVASNRVGVALYPSARSVFKGNSFVGNVVQAVAKGSEVADRNVWADRGLGNYWSSYRGYDAGAGIGAVPHVEGHGTDRLFEAAPVLTALAPSPALRLLRSVEERWSVSTPVLTDPLPLTSPVARSFMADTVNTPTATSGVAALGAALVLVSLAPLLLVRRRREGLTLPGRLSRVYS